MWCSICLRLSYYAIAVAATINIDDKLDSPFSTECFKRISIGERLVVYDVTRTIERTRVKDCEADCQKYKCTYFSFGISASGNGTCELTTRREIARRGDADYDIYQRTKHCMEGRPTGYEESCYRRFQAGRRLDDRLIRHSLPCDTLQACQHQCSVEQHFECHGFNIRLDESGLGRGVCELTSVPTAYIDPKRDFLYDPEFDFYEKDLKNTSPNCGYINEIVSIIPKRNDGTDDMPSKSNDDADFSPKRSRPNSQVPWNRTPTQILRPWTMGGQRPLELYPHRPRLPVYHPNEISNYGATWPKQHGYKPWAHGRAMPMGPTTGRLPGYVIIEAESNRLDRNRPGPNRHLQDRGIPSQSYPTFSQGGFAPGPSDNFHGGSRQVCFQRQYPASRMRPGMVREQYYMSAVSHCEEMCWGAHFSCTGFTYQYSRFTDGTPNCFLTDLSHIDPGTHLMPDRTCDFYNRNPSCQQVNSYPGTDCFSRFYSGTSLSSEALRVGLSAPSLTQCELECLMADRFTCRSFMYNSGKSSGTDNCWLSDWPATALTPAQLKPSQVSNIYERGSFGRGCEYDVTRPPFIGPNPTDIAPYHPQQSNRQWHRDAWQHFTVRGWPCRRGTQCALNREAGFWSCQVEGGDHMQWDYCCRPQHACGYSQGYNYPWCYVGEAGPEQWRPCSDHFYPSYANNQHHSHPQSNYGDQSEYGPPSSWPISYVYSQPPPNETVYFEPNESFEPYPNELHPSEYSGSQTIQFKPSTPASYPKAVVQKLDLKDTANPEIPENSEEEQILNINPRINYSKKIKDSDPPKYTFASEGSVKSNEDTFPNFVKGSTTAEFMKGASPVNDSVAIAQISKTKEILEKIETIIANSNKDAKVQNCDEKAAESMDPKSSGGVGFSLNTTQSLVVKDGDTAMARFWNWGQENYFSKDSKNTE